MGKATSLSDLARHKHFASVTAESNQYFWKAKFEELLNEKKKQMKQIHDLNQSIQSSESQMVNMKSQMKTSLQEKEVTIEELMKEIVHCRMQIQ
jgi:predicted  nucleic acid-binding Zn-ribbon protein